MKKIISILLVSIMVIGIFAGCASKDEDSTSMDTVNTSSEESSDESYDNYSEDSTNEAYDTSSDDDGFYDRTESEKENVVTDISGESYEEINENSFVSAEAESVSTFSIDVDTASYANLRDMINNGIVPPSDAVRIEEMINYFDYEYANPTKEDVFSVNTSMAKTPWDDYSELMMIGIQGYDMPEYLLPDNNIVLLIDVSGSMHDADKLPLLIDAFEILIENFDKNDRVSIVVYAGDSGVVINGTRGNRHETIIEALNDLEAGGSTGGSEGIELAYELAEEYFIEDGNNRIILATDGDFNVGITDLDDLEKLIAKKRDSGIYLSVVGFGRGNYRDDVAERLADNGNGNYSYIDSINEAERVFRKEFASNLFAIANDVKIQVDFNESVVYAYKLVGYENRVMDNEDFDDDTKDAGELGLGHTVTALYEVIMQEDVTLKDNELIATVAVRYKKPGNSESQLMEYAVMKQDWLNEMDDNMNFLWAASVAEFGMILRNEAFVDFNATNTIIERLEAYYGTVSDPMKQEFIELLKTYKELN